MSTKERLDHLFAISVAHGVAITILLRNASIETRTELEQMQRNAAEALLPLSMTEEQIEAVQKVLAKLLKPQ